MRDTGTLYIVGGAAIALGWAFASIEGTAGALGAISQGMPSTVAVTGTGTGTMGAGTAATSGAIAITGVWVLGQTIIAQTEKREMVGLIVVPYSSYPESALHIDEAQAAGFGNTFTLDRGIGYALRRATSLVDAPPAASGLDRDEYPPVIFAENARGPSIKYISSADNRGAGAFIAQQAAAYTDQTRVIIMTIP